MGKAAAATARNLNEAVILMGAQSRRVQGSALAHKRNPFLLQKKSFSPEEEIFSVFQRNRFLTEKKSTWKKARDEVRPKLATVSSVPSSLTDLIKLSSSQKKNVDLGNHLFFCM